MLKNIYLLSHRGLASSVSYDPLFELEDIIVETCNAQLLIPTARDVTHLMHESPYLTPHFVKRITNKVISNTSGFFKPIVDLQLLDGKHNVLLIIGISGADLFKLSAIPEWRQKFDTVAAYIFDAWGFETYPKYTRQIDHIFVPMPEIINSLQEYLGISISLLPFGADALTHGSSKPSRPIDVVSYGRIPQHYHRVFANKFDQPGSGRFYHRFTPRNVQNFPKAPYEQRRDKEDRMLLFKTLRRSKVAIAFDSLYSDMRQFPYPFVTLRWFECGASGCVIVGKRPKTPIADKLLNWEDATIELPDDPQEAVELLEELLQDTKRLHTISQRNYIQNLAQHDWRIRIKSMLEQLEIALPEPLNDQLLQMKRIQTMEAY